jgi:hypothetical protein
MFESGCLIDAAFLVGQSHEPLFNFVCQSGVWLEEDGTVHLFKFKFDTFGVLGKKAIWRDARGFPVVAVGSLVSNVPKTIMRT